MLEFISYLFHKGFFYITVSVIFTYLTMRGLSLMKETLTVLKKILEELKK